MLFLNLYNVKEKFTIESYSWLKGLHEMLLFIWKIWQCTLHSAHFLAKKFKTLDYQWSKIRCQELLSRITNRKTLLNKDIQNQTCHFHWFVKSTYRHWSQYWTENKVNAYDIWVVTHDWFNILKVVNSMLQFGWLYFGTLLFHPVTFGVPQVSLLETLSFTLYIKDIHISTRESRFAHCSFCTQLLLLSHVGFFDTGGPDLTPRL